MKASDAKKGTRVRLPMSASGQRDGRRLARRGGAPVTGAIVSTRVSAGGTVKVALDGNFVGDEGGFRRVPVAKLVLLDRIGADE